MIKKGIILAGGKATRLYPSTKVITKQLLPIYDKPMIYYALSTLMQLKIREIAIIISPEQKNNFETIIGNGKQWGIKIEYIFQEFPDGIAQAYILAEDFIEKSSSALILGDNIFYGNDFSLFNQKKKSDLNKSKIFLYRVSDPNRYGLAKFNNNKIEKIYEKPKKIYSNFAVTGLYFFDNQASKLAKTLKKSKRGELEISSLINIYIKKKQIDYQILDKEMTWLDTGTYDSMLDASNFVKTIQRRQGTLIGNPRDIAKKNKWIKN